MRSHRQVAQHGAAAASMELSAATSEGPKGLARGVNASGCAELMQLFSLTQRDSPRSINSHRQPCWMVGPGAATTIRGMDPILLAMRMVTCSDPRRLSGRRGREICEANPEARYRRENLGGGTVPESGAIAPY